MKPIKIRLRSFIAMYAAGALSLGFISSADADATYNVNAIFSVKLSSVTRESGDYFPDHNWSVIAEEHLIDADISTSGDGEASYEDTSARNAYRNMSVDNTVTQWTSASGQAVLGIAESYVLSELGISIENNDSENLLFTFEYAYMVSAEVDSTTLGDGDGAVASASVDILDDFFSVDVVQKANVDIPAGPYEDQFFYNGTFSFTLAPGESNNISAYSYSTAVAIGDAAP